MIPEINIKEFDYHLDEEKIAKFPLEKRDNSKLLIYRNNTITESVFNRISEIIPKGTLLVCNNTKVIKARLLFFKSTGAKIEIFCLEPHNPKDYERAFSAKGTTQWVCMIGNLKKWKDEDLITKFNYNDKNIELCAKLISHDGQCQIVEFSHNDTERTFGEILEILGRIPIPPYLNRESCKNDEKTYQTLYSKYEGSVAAPTAGLHFTKEVFESLKNNDCEIEEITLHVGAGTFLPVKHTDATKHKMHIEHFDFTIKTVEKIYNNIDNIIAVGTTSVRTLESIATLGYRIIRGGEIDFQTKVSQWEAYEIPKDISGKELIGALLEYMKNESIEKVKASTEIMITSYYNFKVIKAIITNFHQPQSTLLLLISAIVGDNWKNIYKYAINNNFRFLSYGDSSILFK